MKRLIAIDPGNTESAYTIMDEHFTPIKFAKLPNEDLRKILHGASMYTWDEVVIEMVASYGMPVGREVFETCVWIGRFSEAAIHAGKPVSYIYRMEEKDAICRDSRARDSNIRRALIDTFAKHDLKTGKGTKAKPDFFYGFAKDIWASFAVGVTHLMKTSQEARRYIHEEVRNS